MAVGPELQALAFAALIRNPAARLTRHRAIEPAANAYEAQRGRSYRTATTSHIKPSQLKTEPAKDRPTVLRRRTAHLRRQASHR